MHTIVVFTRRSRHDAVLGAWLADAVERGEKVLVLRAPGEDASVLDRSLAAVGLDPSPWRMSHPVRAMYVFLQMPQNTFLAVTIMNASAVLYAHYATNIRSWGPSALEDQQTAGGLMWLLGDMLFLTAIALIIAGWMIHEQKQEAIVDRRLDAERAAIRAREVTLAERLAAEREARP